MRHILATLLFLIPLVASAQLKVDPERARPSYEGYMKTCMDAQRPYRSEAETVPAAAACQCYFEQLPITGTIRLSQFNAGMQACQRDAEADPRGFVENYFSRVRNNFNKRYAPQAQP